MVFADTLYWVAVTWPRDPWHTLAAEARARLGSVHLVTTEEVLTEFLNAMAGAGPFAREQAAGIARDIQADESVTVIAQSHASFEAGLSLYEQRLDKGYSLVDCISMSTIRERGIEGVLTNDHHFAQEGFRVLIQRPT